MKILRPPDAVWFISAGMEKPKKRDHILARRQQYLNYGALSLATVLRRSGYDVRLYHGGHLDTGQFISEIVEQGMSETRFPVLLSIPSFYALSWAQEFSAELKHKYPTLRIIAGGRWVVGSDYNWIRSKLPFVDEIVPGLAEHNITKIVQEKRLGELAYAGSQLAPSFNLDHRLVHEYFEYQPSVEASRGCGMGCAFCEERDIPLTRLKEPILLVSQLNEVAEQYSDRSIKPYLQSSFFAPNHAWSEALASEVIRNGEIIEWRCETRVDSIKPTSIPALAAAGLRVIDLGLESASPQQILRMKKTKQPDRYLRAASDLIVACAQSGVWVKVNFLLYAGETLKTYLETLEWLDSHSIYLKGVSVGSVIVYGGPLSSRQFIDEVVGCGGRMVDIQSNATTGIGEIHLSDEISHDAAEELSLQASRRYMSKDDYFDLKSFSYYPRSYTRSDFEADIENCDAAKLPFCLS